MDPKFKPYRTGMITVLERCPCGKSGHQGKPPVYYICRCDCGKEFVVTGDELSKHPYSCGCTPKPVTTKGPCNGYTLGFVDGTAVCRLRNTRKISRRSKSGVSGVAWNSKRQKWEAYIKLKGKGHFLGYYDKKEDAIKARVEGEKKYFQPIVEKWEKDKSKK